MTTLEQRMQVYRDAVLGDNRHGATALAHDLAEDQGLHDVGHDRFGIWGELHVDEVVHRVRWMWPGTFVMGSPEAEPGRRHNEGPQHEVTLTRGYWIGETPVTQHLWKAVMGGNPSRFTGAFRPVDSVSWHDCQAFCAQLSARVPKLGARLPTEEEWEYACRAGTTTRFWSGNSEEDLLRVGWVGQNSSGSTHPVGELPPNPWGLCDMHGNVWEWCISRYGVYTADPRRVDAAFATADTPDARRVFRGGAYRDPVDLGRSAARLNWPPASRASFWGCRLVRSEVDG